MPYSTYQLYQAERVKSEAELRQADAMLGRMAAAVSQLWGQVIRPVRAVRKYQAKQVLTAQYAECDLAACDASIT